jgi:hypothetical protein
MNHPLVYDEDGPTAESYPPALDGDLLKRYEWAVLLGLEHELAYRVACDFDCDLHQTAQLISGSCPPELAVALATPVRG